MGGVGKQAGKQTKLANVWVGKGVGEGVNKWAGVHGIHSYVVCVHSFTCWGWRMRMLVGIMPLVCSGCIVLKSQECTVHLQRMMYI